MPLVIDASVALTWIFKDEASAETDALFDRVVVDGATVPALFYFEVGNALIQAERRGRTIPTYSSERLSIIRQLPLSVDHDATAQAWTDTIALARAERLTVYDASYLELAVRLATELATRDQALAAAARRRGVAVLP